MNTIKLENTILNPMASVKRSYSKSEYQTMRNSVEYAIKNAIGNFYTADNILISITPMLAVTSKEYTLCVSFMVYNFDNSNNKRDTMHRLTISILYDIHMTQPEFVFNIEQDLRRFLSKYILRLCCIHKDENISPFIKRKASTL